MKITVQGIGAVKNAELKCTKVSVITGKNGSGKSTFGKAVFSLISGIQNSTRYFDYNFIRHVQLTMRKELHIPEATFSSFSKRGEWNEHFLRLLQRAPSKTDGAAQFLKALLNASDDMSTYVSAVPSYVFVGNDRFRTSPDNFHLWLSDRLKRFEEEYYSTDYRSRLAERCIKNEFDEIFIGQVATNNLKDIESVVSIETDSYNLSYSYSNSHLSVSGGETIKPLEAYFISDGNALDTLDAPRSIFKKRSARETITTQINENLFGFIRSRPTLFEYLSSDDLSEIFEILNQVYPYDIYIRNERTFTSNNGISISNEASGRKIFALLKCMLNNGAITEKSILVFDEPENHLHPEWQLLFSKLIKLIAERTGAKIICITHSPTLLFALDVLYRERREDLTVYYAQLQNGLSVFEDCTFDISKAHKALSDPFIKLDLLGDLAI